MVSFRKSFTLDVPPQVVSATMRDPATIKDSELSRQALSVEVKEVEKTDERHLYQVHSVTYARGVAGIDRSKTEASHTEVRWDLVKGTRRWVWHGSHGTKVKIEGNDTLRDAPGGKTVLELSAEVEVSIPIVGKVVEKKIRDGFEENWPNYVALVERKAKQRQQTTQA